MYVEVYPMMPICQALLFTCDLFVDAANQDEEDQCMGLNGN